MTKLKAISPSAAKSKKPFVLIYGAPGARKTWESINFPKSFFCDSEGGATNPAYIERLKKAGGMYFGLDQGSGDIEEIIGQVKALATEKHEFLTFVLDSVSKPFNSEITKEAERLGDKDAFGASKKPAISKIKRLVTWLDKLDMSKVIIAHEKILWANDKQAGTTFDCYDKLAYELDLVLQVVRQGASSKAYVKKSRLPGFEDSSSFDWSYEEFAKRYGKSIMETAATPIVLATPEQIAQVKTMLENIKLTDSKKDKWISENSDNLSEIESHIVEDIIKHLKSKIAPTEEEKPPFLKEKK